MNCHIYNFNLTFFSFFIRKNSKVLQEYVTLLEDKVEQVQKRFFFVYFLRKLFYFLILNFLNKIKRPHTLSAITTMSSQKRLNLLPGALNYTFDKRFFRPQAFISYPVGRRHIFCRIRHNYWRFFFKAHLKHTGFFWLTFQIAYICLKAPPCP